MLGYYTSVSFSLLQVMDNLLAQVTGTKRVVLYSPQDALHLYLSGQLMFTFFTNILLNQTYDLQ